MMLMDGRPMFTCSRGSGLMSDHVNLTVAWAMKDSMENEETSKAHDDGQFPILRNTWKPLLFAFQ